MIGKVNGLKNTRKDASFKSNFDNSSLLAQKSNSIPTFEQYLSGSKIQSDQIKTGLIQTQNIYDYDFTDIKTYTLNNNIEISFDTCWKNKETYVDGTLKLDSDENLATAKVLGGLLNNEIKKYPQKVNTDNDDEFMSSISFNVAPNRLEMRGVCDYSKTDELFDNMMFFLLKPEFSEEDLIDAQIAVKTQISDKTADERAEEYILNKNQEVIKEQIESVTLDDVKNLYNKFLSQSEGSFVITLPRPQFNNSKETIFNSLNQIPLLQTRKQEKGFTKNLEFIDETRTIKGNYYLGSSEYSKSYVASYNPNLKESIIMKILYKEFNSSIKTLDETDKYTSNSNLLIYPDCSYIKLGLTGSVSMDKLKENTNKLIDNLSANPLSETELSKIKSIIREEIKNEYLDQYFRTEHIQNYYTDSDNTLKSYLDTLDKITPDDIQQAAQKYLSGNYIEVIEE